MDKHPQLHSTVQCTAVMHNSAALPKNSQQHAFKDPGRPGRHQALRQAEQPRQVGRTCRDVHVRIAQPLHGRRGCSKRHENTQVGLRFTTQRHREVSDQGSGKARQGQLSTSTAGTARLPLLLPTPAHRHESEATAVNILHSPGAAFARLPHRAGHESRRRFARCRLGCCACCPCCRCCLP